MLNISLIKFILFEMMLLRISTEEGKGLFFIGSRDQQKDYLLLRKAFFIEILGKLLFLSKSRAIYLFLTLKYLPRYTEMGVLKRDFMLNILLSLMIVKY